MKKIGRMAKQIWRLATPFFLKSDKKGMAWLLILADLAMMVITVWTTIVMNRWYNDWTNAFMNSDFGLWAQQLTLYLIVGALMATAGAFKGYVEGWLTVRWREWMTSNYLTDWMTNNNHYRMQLCGNITDNPDQRISEDINLFITNTITYSLTLLQNIIMLGSFLVVLWNLSNSIPLMFGGHNYAFPGYFIVIAIVWAVLGTYIAHMTGRALIKLQYNQQRYEADFRFSLVRVRENSEQIALLKGENVEHTRLMGVFNNVIANTFRTIARNMKLTLVNTGFLYLDGVVISVLLGPSFFEGLLPGGYGAIMQISSAFSTVLTTFKFFMTAYAGIATWKAVINRLTNFLQSSEVTAKIQSESKLKITTQDKDQLSIKNLDVFLPDGKPLISAKDLDIKRGEKVLIKGRTGAGKTTLFRVISGIWPYSTGTVILPKDKKVIVLPQRPYLPIGTLAEAVSYPEPITTYKREDIIQALRDVGMSNFVTRLDEVNHWNQILSGGEQQRIGIARAMLYNPDYLFFDEATASLDEPSEEELYSMLLERMKATTIISIGHRSSLQKFHNRIVNAELQPSGKVEVTDAAKV